MLAGSSAGLDPGQADLDGSGPLHHACARHNDVLVEYLLKGCRDFEVDVRKENGLGMTPMACLFWNFQVYNFTV